MTFRESEQRSSPEWLVCIPVKSPVVAKSRLRSLPSEMRAELAVAMAADVVKAVTSSRLATTVVIVTPDPGAFASLMDGVQVLHDRSSGLNQCLVDAVDHFNWPGRVAAIAADLPAITPTEIEAVLTSPMNRPGVIVPDASRQGTTTYAAVDRSCFHPRFGPDSRTLHVEDGFSEHPFGLDAGIRLDVDDLSDLNAAMEMGVGLRTAEVIRTWVRRLPTEDMLGREMAS